MIENKHFFYIKEFLLSVGLWVSGYVFYVIMTYSVIESEYLSSFGIDKNSYNIWLFSLAILTGLFIGIVVNLLQLFVYKYILLNKSMLFSLFVHVVVFICVCIFSIYIIGDSFLSKYFEEHHLIPGDDNSVGWVSSFILYSVVLHVIIDFFLMFRKKVGKSFFKQIFNGLYINPIEEYRIFMFLDMTSSTTLAERSGHIFYSRLIQDCFADLNDVMLNHDAEVYQYVGDEAVITWRVDEKFDRQNCLKLYFDFSAVLINKKAYYLKNYGVVPQFKASINEGKVVVAEIGLTKTEIAYHGEALHICSRVLNLCNNLKAELLVTGTFFRSLNSLHNYKYTLIKNIDLRGMENSTDLYKIHYKNSKEKKSLILPVNTSLISMIIVYGLNHFLILHT